MAKSNTITAEDFQPVLADLGNLEVLASLDPATFAEERGAPGRGQGSLYVGPIGGGLDIPAATRLYRERADPLLARDGALILYFKSPRRDEELARWRNQLWPWLHVVALYRLQGGAIVRETLQGRASVAGVVERDGFVLIGKRREHVMSPESTVAKFDHNAGGWNGEPGKPGYAHFRWMRRYVGRFASVPERARVLDFGCGAGWCGIEAALASREVELCAFDPSPEMVKNAERNARDAGVAKFTGRPGFGESPPFPADGEAPFDLVISSGVVSFSPDVERWCDGLARTVKAGGTLVIGDIQRESRGMQRRRAERVLLPAREMNAQTADEMRKRLEKRGFAHEATAGYQWTDPVPQLTHRTDRTLGGALSPLLLAFNKLAAGSALGARNFDSWVMRLRKAR